MNPIWSSLIGGLLTVVASVGAASGFWTWMQRRDTKKDATTRLLMGLAHDRIIFLGKKYLERGYLSADEFEDLNTYLYEPYADLGGNGLAKRVVEEVGKLPFRPISSYWPSETEKAT